MSGEPPTEYWIERMNADRDAREQGKANTAPMSRTHQMLVAFDALLDAAEGMLNTCTFQRGRYPDDANHYGHEYWAERDLEARVKEARLLIASLGGKL